MATNDMVHGLRGWGVFFLLLFHHYTKSFPNGYVGADIIIVVSGFIAGYVLRNERIIDQKTIRDFCLKRAKSILPLYYLALFIILIFCYVLLPISYLQTNLEKSKTALLMISNIKLSCFENNFSVMLPSIEDAFGHTWLPCLLMQWYIVAPFLFWIQKRTTDKEFFFFADAAQRFFRCVCMLFRLLFVFAENHYQLLHPLSTMAILCRNHCCLVSPKASSLHTDWMQYGRSFLNHPIFFLPLLIPMLWFRFPSFDLRLYITVATTLLLYAGHKNENFPFITNRLAVNLGKIFYPLYLTHWPIYILAKYHVGALHNGRYFEVLFLIFSVLSGAEQFKHVKKKRSKQIFSGEKLVVSSWMVKKVHRGSFGRVFR
ncbi:acyltransferase [Cooperia oncophora]